MGRGQRLPQRTCASCGETYRFRGEDRHQGSDYCLANTLTKTFRGDLLRPIERSETVLRLVELLKVRHRVGRTALEPVVRGKPRPFRAVVAVERLWVDLTFETAYRMTQGIPFAERKQCLEMLLADPAEMAALHAEQSLRNLTRKPTRADHRSLIERACTWKALR
jgi:hypothetical protein